MLLVLTAFGAAPATETASAGEVEPWTIDEWREELPFKTGLAVVVENEHGDVRLRRLRDNKLAVFAARQTPPGAPPQEIRIDMSASQAVVRVVAATGASGRVDLAVFVPNGTPCHVRTRAGRIELNGLTALVEAESESGFVRYKGSGAARLSTKRGEISCLITSAPWREPFALRTETGNIAVYLPRNPRGRVLARTAGELTTDYSLSVTRQPGGLDKRARVDLGPRRWFGLARRGPDLHIDSAIGNIHVLQLSTELLPAVEEQER